jgi:2-C-methyl-D-erythritol 2,4-cyclodiphosphate synthase
MNLHGLRVGNGVDFHSFSTEEGDFKLALGGVSVPFHKKVLAHSDGDVILHSICEALFGAMGEGNIGTHFPPSDQRWKGANSTIFVKHALDLLKQKNGVLINIDITVICEVPKIMPIADGIKKNLSEVLQTQNISVKATTTEKLGFLGRGEGIGAIASSLIYLNLIDSI